MKGYRVEFILRTPMVVPVYEKTLDAVMAWASVRREEFYGNPASWDKQHVTGIARHQVDQAWCPMASLLDIQWASEPDQLSYIKRQKLQTYVDAWMDKIIDRFPTIDITRGSTKAGLYFHSIRWASVIKAWVVVDDSEQFMSLLPWVTHIGKLWHKDMGAVRSWSVYDDDTAFEQWTHRPLPLGSPYVGDKHVRSMGSLVSPYWKRSNHRPVMIPAM